MHWPILHEILPLHQFSDEGQESGGGYVHALCHQDVQQLDEFQGRLPQVLPRLQLDVVPRARSVAQSHYVCESIKTIPDGNVDGLAKDTIPDIAFVITWVFHLLICKTMGLLLDIAACPISM